MMKIDASTGTFTGTKYVADVINVVTSTPNIVTCNTGLATAKGITANIKSIIACIIGRAIAAGISAIVTITTTVKRRGRWH